MGRRSYRAQGVIAAGDYFGTIGVGVARGRTFTEEERTEVGAHPVVVISHDLWAGRLGRPDIVGSELRVNGRPYTVVGVLPESYRGRAPGIMPDLWVPMTMREHPAPGAGTSDNLFGTGRVAEGVTIAQDGDAQVPYMRIDACVVHAGLLR